MQAAEFEYVVGMYGNGKYILLTTDAALVIVAVFAVLVVVLVLVAVPAVVVVAVALPVPVPNTAPPVPVAVPMFTVPVHFAPVGQQATFFAPSVVQNEPTVQHAPASAAASVEQEL